MFKDKPVKVSKPNKTDEQFSTMRVTKTIRKMIQNSLDKVNKKEFGKPIRLDELLEQLLLLVDAKFIEQLQMKTYSNEDIQGLAYIEYKKTNGSITKDKFLGKVLSGQLLDFMQGFLAKSGLKFS